VWLNTPRRPKEASGTSGMKVIYNGGLNCSILDGWWDEGYDPSLGWAIGGGEMYPESEADTQDFVESEALYNILENDLIPQFYERGRDSVPRLWMQKIKSSYKKLAPFFTTHRMVQEYTANMYMPDFRRANQLTSPTLEKGLEYAQWRAVLDKTWKDVTVNDVKLSQTDIQVGKDVQATATLHLGSLTPADVRVELYYGSLTPQGEISTSGTAVEMLPSNKPNADGSFTYTTTVVYSNSGDRGVSVRVTPNYPFLSSSFQPRLITWA
jgi:glycogen phosphorylase